jgi:hypothetical protein
VAVGGGGAMREGRRVGQGGRLQDAGENGDPEQGVEGQDEGTRMDSSFHAKRANVQTNASQHMAMQRPQNVRSPLSDRYAHTHKCMHAFKGLNAISNSRTQLRPLQRHDRSQPRQSSPNNTTDSTSILEVLSHVEPTRLHES